MGEWAERQHDYSDKWEAHDSPFCLFIYIDESL